MRICFRADERPLVRGVAREDALQVRPRAIDLAERLFVERRCPLGEIELRRRREARLAGGGDRVGDRGHELRRALRPLSEDSEAIPDRQLARKIARRAGDDVERDPESAELFVNARQADIERAAILLRRGRRDPHLEDLGLPSELPGVSVRCVEHDSRRGAGLPCREELLHHADRLLVQRCAGRSGGA